MGEVIDIQVKKPHMTGTAVCLNCHHTWQSVSPIGVSNFECPECLTMKGVFNNPCEPFEKELWECDCGCQHFVVSKEYIHCAHCGVSQEFPNG